jgi:hypothetical protein
MLKLIILILFLVYFILFKKNNFNYFKLNPDMKIKIIENDIFVIDNFYKYPNLIKNHYLKKEFNIHNSIYQTFYINPDLRYNFELINFFELLTNYKIDLDKWNSDTYHNSNGFIQYIIQINNPCIHSDDDSNYGVVVYMGDNDHPLNGTSFYQHKETGLKVLPSDQELESYSNEKKEKFKYYQENHLWNEGEPPQFDKWKKYYQCYNKFNRAIIFNSKRFHCAEKGYGTNRFNSRLFQTFFF